jgi:hypothetical protein
MNWEKDIINKILLGFVSLIFVLLSTLAAAEPLSVQVHVERQEVTIGETFLMQIKIDGDDTPSEPDLSGLQGFTVQAQGGGPNNRESITIINGKVNRVSEHGYVFNYRLTPKKDGILTIPAISITAAGKTLLTQPVTIKVTKPQMAEEFELRQSLSINECYVGQPLTLTVVWYVNLDIEEFQFMFPVLQDQRFEVVDFPEDRNYSGRDAIAINLHGSKVIARKKDIGQYVTVTLRRIIIPKTPGLFSFEPVTVSSRVIAGYRRYQGRQPGSPFDNSIFDDILGRRQPVIKQLLTESNTVELQVKPIPEENRPHDFSGLVGNYSLAADASPTEVNVGDPITLNIMVTGSEYLDNVILPPLHKQPEMDNFKVPEEMGQGQIDGKVKVFTQTIRAKTPAIKEIPAIGLTYFNPEVTRFETARTNVIPLRVKATKIVTATDAEGLDPGAGKTELATLDEGIAHNYVGDDLLVNQHIEITSWFSSSLGLILLVFPPAVYLLLLIPIYYKRRRMADEAMLQAKRALRDFSKELARLRKNITQSGLQETATGLLDAIKCYLGSRLSVPSGSLVFADVVDRLQQQGVGDTELVELQRIMDWCEAYHYGGVNTNGSGQDSLLKMIDSALDLFKVIEGCF